MKGWRFVRRKSVWKRLTASMLAAGMMLWTPFTASAGGEAAEPIGKIVLSGEVFTLGQGYFYEPAKVDFYEGESCADILKRAFADANLEIQYSGEGSSFYLTGVKDADKGFVCLPGYMETYLSENDVELESNTDEWLEAFDYTSMSGWMYTVNNEMPNVGMGNYYPESGDVMRLHFTTYGYGADIGFGWGSSADEMADKDEITRLLAELTDGDLKKTATGDTLASLFPSAVTVADVVSALEDADMDTNTPGWLTGSVSDGVTQENVDAVVAELRTSLERSPEEPDLDQKKAAAKRELEAYKSAEAYDESGKAALASAVAAGKSAIDAAETEDGVAAALTAAKAAIDQIPTERTGPEEPVPDPEQPAVSSDIPEDFENDLWLQYDFKEMTVGDTVDIYPRRVPQIVGSAVANDVHRPNFHFEILRGDSISLDTIDTTDKANVTAEKPGITIVKVTYDETDYKDVHYGATAVTNAAYAVFAVSAASAEDTGITITPKAEIQPGVPLTSYDTIYYTEGDTVDYVYGLAIEGADSVRVTCNGHEVSGTNGEYTLPLENRSNIIGVTAVNEKGVKYYYQVIDARKIEINVENKTDPGQPLEIGDTAAVSFKGIANPVYKLATIYNPTMQAWGGKGTYVEYVNKELSEEPFKGYCNQWNLATKNQFEVTFQEAGSYTFSGGKIFSSWWGSQLGADKGVYGQGDPNLSAPILERYFCDMPDFTIVVKDPTLEAAKSTAKAELDSYKDPAGYDEAGKKALAEAVVRGKAAIDAAVDAKTVANALADAKKAMDAVQTSSGGVDPEKPGETLDVSNVLERTLAYIYRNAPAPSIGTIGGEWSVMALAGGEYDVATGYFDKYYDRVVKELQDNNGILEGDRKYTEYSRVIMALSAIGRDATDVGGYNLAEKLANYDKVVRQGINGSIFALIALDTKGYTTSDPDIRQKYVEDILSQEIAGGGFSLTGGTPDPDITAMAIQGLTPYRNDSRVKAAINRAVAALSNLQEADGGLSSWGSSNSESVAQTVIALCGLGIDPHNDETFIKNGSSLMDALLTFEAEGGGFMHVKAGDPTGDGAEGGAADGMASDQAALALLAYKRMSVGEPPIYDHNDGGASSSKTEKVVKQYPSADGKGIWKQYADGRWELFDADDTAPLTGWQKIDGNWYYFQENGKMSTGWLEIGGKTYYLKSWGAMQTGWFQVDSKWYCCDSSGAIRTQEQPLTEAVYEYPASGGSGIWVKHQDGRWSFRIGTAQAMGWLKIDGTWYFFGSDHAMRTGWQLINGTWYYLGVDGKMNTGWKRINAKWYYFLAWGGMKTGWLKDGADWYYLNADGSMLAGAVMPDGYSVGADGRLAD